MLCNASRERPKKSKKQKTKGEKKNAPINKQLYPLAPRPPLLPLLFSRVVQAEQVVGDDEGPGHGGQVEDLGEFEGVGLALGLWVRGRRKKMRGQVDGWGKKKSISLLFLSLCSLSLFSTTSSHQQLARHKDHDAARDGGLGVDGGDVVLAGLREREGEREGW